MTDKELLELAAKAAEAEFESSDEEGIYLHQPIGGHSGFWNPLTDDGDAMRLAVKLHMTVRLYMGVTCAQIGVPGQQNAYINEVNSIDPNAATRRAIVRAAAKIGKENP